MGDDAFMVPCHRLSPMLQFLPMTVIRYRRKAVRDGYLRVTKEHTFRSGGKGDATEFCYVEGK